MNANSEREDGLAPFLDKVSSMSPTEKAELVAEIARASRRVTTPPGAASIGTPSGFRYRRQASDPKTRYFTFEGVDGVRRGLLRQTAEADEIIADGVWVATDWLIREWVNPSTDRDLIELSEREARDRALHFGVAL